MSHAAALPALTIASGWKQSFVEVLRGFLLSGLLSFVRASGGGERPFV